MTIFGVMRGGDLSETLNPISGLLILYNVLYLFRHDSAGAEP
jgi:hypothetical protein